MSRLFRRPRKSRRRAAVEQAIGALERIRRGSARTARAKSEGGAYSKAVGLGISALVALIIISLSVWLLRRRSREEAAPVPLEVDEEAVLLEDEEVVVPPGAPTPREEPMP